MPSTTILLCPIVSASQPPKAKSAASESRYALTAHCTPVLERPSFRWISGTAIDTIVWSMNVIDTATIIAARMRFRGRATGAFTKPPRSRGSRMRSACRSRSRAIVIHRSTRITCGRSSSLPR